MNCRRPGRRAPETSSPSSAPGTWCSCRAPGRGLPGGGLLHTGKLGGEVSIEQGYDCARQTMLNLLTNLKGAIGDLDKVSRIVKLLAMVNSTPDFGDTPRVANGASDLLINLYGERGRHARSAVGMATLPGGMPIEIEMIVEVED